MVKEFRMDFNVGNEGPVVLTNQTPGFWKHQGTSTQDMHVNGEGRKKYGEEEVIIKTAEMRI